MNEQLSKRGMLEWNAVICTFYKSDVESIGHLFFSNDFSLKPRMYCCSTLGLSWSIHKEPMAVFWHGSLHSLSITVIKFGRWLSSLLRGLFG